MLDLYRQSRAREMSETNIIFNFEALMKKSIFAFTRSLSISNISIICTVQKSWEMRETVWKTKTDNM